MEKLARDKHSSLSCKSVIYGPKKVLYYRPRVKKQSYHQKQQLGKMIVDLKEKNSEIKF
jgi:hypothetical protein